MKRFLAELSIAIFIFLVLVEVSFRIYTHYFLFYDVEMTRYATELKIEAQNPRIGHLHRPNASLKLMGVDVKTNSEGFRDDEYTKARNSKTRIIFLGDSLTFGWGVEKEETFESLLESHLSRNIPTEIINFCHGNYNTDQEVNLFAEKGLQYKPDKVVLFYFINDAEPTPVKSRWAFLGYFRSVTLVWSRYKAIASRISGHFSYKHYYSDLYSESRPAWSATKLALEHLKGICDDSGIKVQVVLLPELHELVNYPFLREHKMLTDVLTRLGIPYLDLVSRFRDVRNPRSLWVAPDDAHPNSKAHRMIAEFSKDFILGDL